MHDAVEDEPTTYRDMGTGEVNWDKLVKDFTLPTEEKLGLPVKRPVDWRTVQLCREMCRAQGHDPDQMVVDAKSTNRGPLGSVVASDAVPAWTLFVEAAHAVGG